MIPPVPRLIMDRYQVVRALGEGESASTSLCTDLRDGRPVAVKELHFQHLTDWRHLDLFTREATVLARLDHPGIPKVYDFFRDETTQSVLILVQEYIEGASLAERVADGPLLGEREVLDLTLGILDVLEYLHGRIPPVLHRDIKPSNILIRRDGHPVLIDFGGVCFGWRPPDHTGTTVVGTSGFMPPEQFMGQANPTSDLYALGATLLTVITGIPPHKFPFESGRIEVPIDLPVRPSLRNMIEAVLRPASRDRPASAAKARAILMDDRVAESRALRPVDGASHLGRSRRTTAVVGSGGPVFVELPPAPRDPADELADVWHNLIDPLFPVRSSEEAPLRGYPLGLYTFLSIISLGFIPMFYGILMRKRERRYDWLFREGEFARGWVVSVSRGDVLGTCTFEFDAEGVTYRGMIEYASGLCRHWSNGDAVAVLFDPGDPRHSCVVFR